MMSGMPLEICWPFNERWNSKFYYKVASCWLFLLIHTAVHGSMNIKKRSIIFIFEIMTINVMYIPCSCLLHSRNININS